MKEVLGKLSLDRRRNAGTLAEEILDFGLRGVARPELLAAAGLRELERLKSPILLDLN